MTSGKFLAKSLLLLALAGGSAAFAEPSTISIQGKLERSNGSAVSGNRAYRIRYYGQSSGGAQVGSDVTGITTIPTSGRFSIVITPPSALLALSTAYYELAIDSAAVADGSIDAADIFPQRVQMHSVPWARNAGQLGGTAASSYVKTTDLTNASTTTLGGSQFWRLGGNTIASGPAPFLGSINEQPFQIKVNNTRALLINPGFGGNPVNIVLGDASNSMTSNTYAGTIGGGGAFFAPNHVTAPAGTVAGGWGNTAGNLAAVGGGSFNAASGENSAVVGGILNTASGNRSFIGGGSENQATLFGAFVAGGNNNSAGGPSSAIGGGDHNNARGDFSHVGGGLNNSARGNYSAIAGGNNNATTGTYAAVPGGRDNSASSPYAFAAGRQAKAYHTGAFVWADSTAADFASTANNQFLIRATGGVGINTTTTQEALNVNGNALVSNNLKIKNSNALIHAANQPSLGQAAGFDPNLNKLEGLILEQSNNSGDAAGIYMDDDTMVLWSPGDNGLLRIYDEDNLGQVTPVPALLLDGNGYLGLNTATTGFNPISVGTNSTNGNGAFCSVGGVWTDTSDRNTKENFKPVNPQQVLEKVAAMPVTEWQYKGQPQARHIGPVAQDFHAAFGVGDDDKHIASLDTGGVALAAIKALNEKLAEKDTQIKKLEARLNALEARSAKPTNP